MDMRTRIHVTGVVQGVGFRPFVYNLARKYNLRGFCLNDSEGVVIEVEGAGVEAFISEMRASPPPLSRIESLITQRLGPAGVYSDFRIEESLPEEGRFTLVSPDIATCPDCLRELFSPDDRRFRYPFINCTNCGARYSIILDIPYDRPKTTMSGFPMCAECEEEYRDPGNRRFHAQPNACPECGPRAWLIEKGAKGGRGATSGPITEEVNFSAIARAARLIKEGAVIAVKGLGGFHIACDAENDGAVRRLRERKRRSLVRGQKEGSNKPFALMARDIERLRSLCSFNDAEIKALEGTLRPIVIMEKKYPNTISGAVAPGVRSFGCMLPYTPLHHLLLSVEGAGFTALVMTSGNLSEEPIVISNEEAVERLSPLVDFFLLHDRPIYMRVDDSIVRFTRGEDAQRVLRRGRGFTPVVIDVGGGMEEILATGAELKNTFTLTKGGYAVVSQHIGDLVNLEELDFFRETLKNLKNTFRVEPVHVAHDLHPDYLSTGFAEEYFSAIEDPGKKIIPVQHHHAHIVSAMAEHNLYGEVIGVALDGTGFGTDGALWGGEFLLATRGDFTRKAHLMYQRLPGGDTAVKEPWRTALSYLHSTFGDEMYEAHPAFFERFDMEKVDIVVNMMKRGLNSPLTSSAGRFFDALSSILGIRDVITFEGEAAIELETVAWDSPEGAQRPYSFEILPGEALVIDTRPVIRGVVEDLCSGVNRSRIASRFHWTVARMILSLSRIISKEEGARDVVLSGGVFQNALLLEMTTGLLKKEGFRVWTNEKTPVNDGGVSLGQAVVARERIKREKVQ